MLLKIIFILLLIFVVLFLLSLVIYFFNLDMKLAAKIAPILSKHYDKIKRDKNI